MNINERKALSIVLNETTNSLFKTNDKLTEISNSYERLLVEMITNPMLNDAIHTVQERNKLGFVSASFATMGVNENFEKAGDILNELGFLILKSRAEEVTIMSVDWYEHRLNDDILARMNESSVEMYEPKSYYTPMVVSLRGQNPLYTLVHQNGELDNIFGQLTQELTQELTEELTEELDDELGSILDELD